MRWSAEQVLPGIKISSENPLIYPVILAGKERFIKLDPDTGIVDVYEAHIKAKKIKSTTMAELGQNARILPEIPTIDDKVIMQIEKENAYINPILYSIDSPPRLLEYCIKILSFIQLHILYHNLLAFKIHLFSFEMLDTFKLSYDILSRLANTQYKDLPIDIEVIS